MITTRHNIEIRLILLKLVNPQRWLIVLLCQSWRLAVISITFSTLRWLVVIQRIVSRFYV